MSFVNKKKSQNLSQRRGANQRRPARSGKVTRLLRSTEGDESSPDGVMTRSPRGGWREKEERGKKKCEDTSGCSVWKGFSGLKKMLLEPSQRGGYCNSDGTRAWLETQWLRARSPERWIVSGVHSQPVFLFKICQLLNWKTLVKKKSYSEMAAGHLASSFLFLGGGREMRIPCQWSNGDHKNII